MLSGLSSLDNYSQCSTNLSVAYVLYSETHSVKRCTLQDRLHAFWELEALGIQEEEGALFDDFAIPLQV